MDTKVKKISSEELQYFQEERDKGAVYIAITKKPHYPTFSGMLVGPVLEEDRFHRAIPVHALKKRVFNKLKPGEEGAILDVSYEEGRIKFLRVNWREAISVYYSNPIQIKTRDNIQTFSLERVFDFAMKKRN